MPFTDTSFCNDLGIRTGGGYNRRASLITHRVYYAKYTMQLTINNKWFAGTMKVNRRQYNQKLHVLCTNEERLWLFKSICRCTRSTSLMLEIRKYLVPMMDDDNGNRSDESMLVSVYLVCCFTSSFTSALAPHFPFADKDNGVRALTSSSL